MLIGIDIGGTNLVAAKVNDDGQIIQKISTSVDRSISADGLCSKIISMAQHVAGNDQAIDAVGIGFPGLVDNHAGVVIQTPNMPFANAPFRQLFQEAWNIPVFMGNDANCAAIGEYWAGAAKGCDTAMVITLGTGVGGGLINHGKLFSGFANGAMEVGHMVINPGGPLCGCGSKGCFEQYASATALIRNAREQMATDNESLLWSLCQGESNQIDGRMVFQAVKMGDTTAQRVLDEYTTNLALGLANLINILQPEITCLGGGISSAEDEFLFDPVRRKVRQYMFDKNAPVRIERALLGNDAGLIGAAMLCKTV